MRWGDCEWIEWNERIFHVDDKEFGHAALVLAAFVGARMLSGRIISASDT